MADTPATAPSGSAAPAANQPPPPVKVETKVEAKVETPPPPPPNTDTSDKSQNWRFFLDGRIGAARLGGPNGQPFGHDFNQFNDGYDYSLKTLGVGFGYKLWDPSPYFQLWAGAQGGYRNYSGDQKAPGEMHGGYLGGHICANMEGLYQPSAKASDRIFLGPEFCLPLSAILMTGNSTAGDNFSVDHTGGLGLAISPTLSPVGFQLGTAQIKPFAFMDSSFIPHARGDANAPLLAWGGGLSVGWTFGKVEEKEKPVVVKDCGSSLELLEKLRAEINGTKDQPGLKDQITEYEKKIAEKRALLKTRPTDPLDDAGVLKRLRDDRADQLAQKELEGLDPKKDKDKIVEIKAKAMAQAEKDFPNVESFWNPPLPQDTDKKIIIPDNLKGIPCEDLDKMLKTATEGRDNLKARLTALQKAYDAPFSPQLEKIITEVKNKVVPNFKDIHFENNRPTPQDLTTFKTRLAAASSGGKVDWDNPQLKATMNGIFGAAYVPKVVKAIQDTAGALNGDPIVKKVSNMTVEGHTSKAGGDAINVPLSDRRANMVMEMLVAEGVDRSRLSAKGFGYSKPKTPEEGLKPGSPEAAAAAADNRRIELDIPDSEVVRIKSMGGNVPVLNQPSPPPKPNNPTPPPQPPPSNSGKPNNPPPPPPSNSGKAPPPPPPPPGGVQ